MTPVDISASYVSMLYLLADHFDHLSDDQVSDALNLMARLDPKMLAAAQSFVARVLAAESMGDVEIMMKDGHDLFGIDCDRRRMN